MRGSRIKLFGKEGKEEARREGHGKGRGKKGNGRIREREGKGEKKGKGREKGSEFQDEKLKAGERKSSKRQLYTPLFIIIPSPVVVNVGHF